MKGGQRGVDWATGSKPPGSHIRSTRETFALDTTA